MSSEAPESPGSERSCRKDHPFPRLPPATSQAAPSHRLENPGVRARKTCGLRGGATALSWNFLGSAGGPHALPPGRKPIREERPRDQVSGRSVGGRAPRSFPLALLRSTVAALRCQHYTSPDAGLGVRLRPEIWAMCTSTDSGQVPTPRPCHRHRHPMLCVSPTWPETLNSSFRVMGAWPGARAGRREEAAIWSLEKPGWALTQPLPARDRETRRDRPVPQFPLSDAKCQQLCSLGHAEDTVPSS